MSSDIIDQLRKEAYPEPKLRPDHAQQTNVIVSRLALLWSQITDAHIRTAYIVLILQTMEAQYRRVAPFDEGAFQEMLTAVGSAIAYRRVSGQWPDLRE